MDSVKLKFWEGKEGGILDTIAQVANDFFNNLEGSLNKISSIINEGKVDNKDNEDNQEEQKEIDIRLIELLGWERDIDRYPGEPEEMFRNRVRYALTNAKCAGSRTGFEKIWENLELGEIKQLERFDAENWDVIRLIVEEKIFQYDEQLLKRLLTQYGRTCRRYTLEGTNKADLGLRPFDFDCVVLNSSYSDTQIDCDQGVRLFDFDYICLNSEAN